MVIAACPLTGWGKLANVLLHFGIGSAALSTANTSVVQMAVRMPGINSFAPAVTRTQVSVYVYGAKESSYVK